MTTDHTPGPWEAFVYSSGSDQSGLYHSFISGDRGDNTYIVAEVILHTEADNYMSFSVAGMSEANARLIAAAPETLEQRNELLAALEAVLPAVCKCGSSDCFETNARAVAEAAIAKARA